MKNRNSNSECDVKQLHMWDREFDPSNQSLIEWRAFEKALIGKIREGELKEIMT